jgi:hypothetical protein
MLFLATFLQIERNLLKKFEKNEYEQEKKYQRGTD